MVSATTVQGHPLMSANEVPIPDLHDVSQKLDALIKMNGNLSGQIRDLSI